ncbi:hypothetical protein ACIQZG_13075 [Lysinibacillus sp. NPDC096418]|uniref:hypothetical protein n=1 Tax=Lysinibacillus sp. NPDC096418 TaxID=3364138 RepID=UPI003811AF46
MGLLIACKSNEEQVLEKFDPKKIDFSNFLVETIAEIETKTYSIKVTNNSEVPLEYLNLYLSYPIVLENGSKSNDFSIIGLPLENNAKLEHGQSINFTFVANLETVHLEKVDVDSPMLKLIGFINNNTPFDITGAAEALSESD